MAVRNDTHDRYYECVECGERTEADSYLGHCPECGAAVRNLAVPREQ